MVSASKRLDFGRHQSGTDLGLKDRKASALPPSPDDGVVLGAVGGGRPRTARGPIAEVQS